MRQGSIKDSLRSVLTAEELKRLVSGFDTLGNIAIIEVPKGLGKKQRLIAKAVLDSNPAIKTVVKKTGAHQGKFRVEPVRFLAGEKNLTADYRESGCRFRVSLGKVFFSPRLSMERLRIAKLIQPGEVVGAFFAGVGPFPIVFAKNSEMKQAVAIELNPVAVKDLKFNIGLNKLNPDKKNPVIIALEGDVNKIVPKKFKGRFDRIAMPIPKSANTFLKAALLGIKPSGGVIHFYSFSSAENPFEPIEKIIEAECEKNGFKVKFVFERQVRTFSKDTVQVVIDFWAAKLGANAVAGNR